MEFIVWLDQIKAASGNKFLKILKTDETLDEEFKSEASAEVYEE